MLTVTTSAKLVRDLKFRAYGVTSSDFSNGCTAPQEVRLRGLPDRVSVAAGIEREQTAFHTVIVPCRKCETCLTNRSRRWAAKAFTEIKGASRTWFGTLTFAPDERLKCKWSAMARATKRGHLWQQMTADERFAYIHHECGAEVTRWIKRIRKNSGAHLRYLLVVEPHKDGFPHYHILVHEYGEPISYRQLSDAWKVGFTRMKLDDDRKSSWYVCKYMAKTALCRIRASQHYGPYAGRSLTERVIAATRSFH